MEPIPRVSARVLPVSPDGVAAGWWTPEALVADGGAIAEDLPGLMALAVQAVR